MREPSTTRRIVHDYYRITSAVSIPDEVPEHRDANLISLRRRLGPWFQVRGLDVLDLGSGTGELCELAIKAGARTITGVNLSEGENAHARGYCAGAELVTGEIVEYTKSRESQSCDRIFALNIIEHLSKDDVGVLLAECARVLRPGGQMIGIVPNATSPFGAMTRYWDFTHEVAFTPSSVNQLARLSGFGKMEYRECGPVPHGLISGLRYVAWQAIRFVIWLYLMIELASNKGGIYTADMQFRLTMDDTRDDA